VIAPFPDEAAHTAGVNEKPSATGVIALTLTCNGRPHVTVCGNRSDTVNVLDTAAGGRPSWEAWTEHVPADEYLNTIVDTFNEQPAELPSPRTSNTWYLMGIPALDVARAS